MPAAGLVLAQCVDAGRGCDLPRTLPWYFGLAIGLAWVAALAGAGILLRRRLLARRGRRRLRRGELTERAGSELEPW